MNQQELYNKLQSGETVYLLDDFEEAVVRLYLDNGQTKSYIRVTTRPAIQMYTGMSYQTIRFIATNDTGHVYFVSSNTTTYR